MNAQNILKPNIEMINAFLYALFAPDFVHHFPNAWIEVVSAKPDDPPNTGRFFSAHDLEAIVAFIARMNAAGRNCYVGAALRQGDMPNSGRASKQHFCAASHFWADYDNAGDYERVVALCNEHGLRPAMEIITGTQPHRRAHVYFKCTSPITDGNELERGNTSLRDLFGSDKVQNYDRIMRVAGTINYPNSDKGDRGYVTELITVQTARDAPSYSASALSRLHRAQPAALIAQAPVSPDHRGAERLDAFAQFGDQQMREAGRLTDADLHALIAKHPAGTGDGWHNDMRAVTWELLRRGYDPLGIQMVIGSACKRGFDDPDIGRLVYKKWELFQAEKQAAERDDADTGTKKANSSTALALSYYNELTEVPPKRWIIKNVLARGETSNWFGPPGVGKSVLLTDLVFHVAAAVDWRGYRLKERCGIVYLALERGALVKRRLAAYMQKWGVLDLPIAVASNVIDLKNKGCIKIIVDAVREAEASFGCKAGVIVIDTMSKGIAAGGGDEDKAKDVNIVAANLRRIEELTDIHIACVGHTGKDEGRGHRGSNANSGDMDMMVQIKGDGAVKTATIVKINDGIEGPLTNYKIESYQLGTDEDGDPITTAVVSDDTVEAEQEANKKGLSKAQRRAMELLTRCINDQGRPAPQSSEFPHGVRVVSLKEWHEACERGGLSSAEKPDDRDRAFRRAKDDLQTFSRIACLDGLVWLVRDDG